MIPDISPDRIRTVGNAAGDGARVALLDKEKREEANWIACRVEYVELTTGRQFQDKFVASLSTSHSQDFLCQVEAG